MCMDYAKVKKTCLDVCQRIDAAAAATLAVADEEGCSGCQGLTNMHSKACEASEVAITRLEKKLLQLQRLLNGVICYQWSPGGRVFVVDRDALNHSFL